MFSVVHPAQASLGMGDKSLPEGLCQGSLPGLSPSVSPCSDIYLMEKELAKEQERNNRHRPPKILEPPSFQEPPPKVRRG